MLPLLHVGHAVNWHAWHFESTVVGGALIVLGLYFYGIDRRRRADPTYVLPWRRIGFFVGGSLFIFLALTSPLDTAAGRLLSFHMVQHIVIATLAPPIVLLGLPPVLIELVLRGRRTRRLVELVTLPYVAAAIFIINMWLWHAPPLYELALTNLPVHATMHIAFMGTGLIYWWPIIQPLPRPDAPGEASRLLYVFVSGFPMGILALILLSSPYVLYDYYLTAPRLWGVGPLPDQQVAGVIMGILGESTSFIAFTYLFFKLMNRDDAPVAAPAPRWVGSELPDS